MTIAAQKSPQAKSERFEVRLQLESKQRVEKAARLSGVNLSEFTRRSLVERAEAIIEAHERTQLAPIDHASFFEAINAPRAIPALTDAMKRHALQVESQ